MQIEVKRWGNSLALRLPKHILDSASLKEGTPVELSVEDGAVVVRSTRKKYNLSELLEGHNKAAGCAEHDWGQKTGEEEW